MNTRKASRKNRKNNRKASPRNRNNNRKQRGGAAAFPDVFGTMLDANLRASAGVDKIDAAMAELPQFAGTYGMTRAVQDGGRRRNSRRRNSRKNRKNCRKNSRKNRKNSRKNRKNSRKNRKNSRKNSRKQRGGAFGDDAASVNAPANLMSKDMYAYAHMNPQFYNENVINTNFQGPSNSYAPQ
jgi:hypothetical protein